MEGFPVGDHDLLKSEEGFLLDLFGGVVEEGHDGALEIDLLKDEFALGVLADDLADVPAGNGDDGGGGGDEFLVGEDGAELFEGRIVVFVEAVNVGAPEAFGAVHGRGPIELLTE